MITVLVILVGVVLGLIVQALFNWPPSDYMPGTFVLARWAKWNVRNPFRGIANLFYVSVIPNGQTWNPKGGWQLYNCKNGLPRFVSYRGKHIEWYIGWRPSGLFGIAIRKAKASNYK